MMAASTYLPSITSRTMVASSIQGTGAQNLPIALRKGCSAVSGIALGPTFASRWRASSLDKPLGDGIAAVDDFAGVESAEGEDIVAAINNALFCAPLMKAKARVTEIGHRDRPAIRMREAMHATRFASS